MPEHNNQDPYDILDKGTLDPPELESKLKQHSKKIPMSTRLFPEWAAAGLTIIKKKYPQESVRSTSQLIALIVQDYINKHYELLNNNLPPTEQALNILIRKGFVNPDNKRQFKGISGANQKATEYEAEKLSSDNPVDRYEYFKNRDPEKADKILQEMSAQIKEDLEEAEEQPDQQQEEKRQSNPNEEVVQDNRSNLEKKAKQREQEQQKPAPDFLDQIPDKQEQEE